MGKNKVAQIALGRSPEDEFKDNLRHLSSVSISNNYPLQRSPYSIPYRLLYSLPALHHNTNIWLSPSVFAVLSETGRRHGVVLHRSTENRNRQVRPRYLIITTCLVFCDYYCVYQSIVPVSFCPFDPDFVRNPLLSFC